MTSCFEAVDAGEHSLPRQRFITFGTTLDNCELVLLAGENCCFPVSPTATASHTRSPLCNPLQAERRKRKKHGRRDRRMRERRGGSEKPIWPQGGKPFQCCHRCPSREGCGLGHPSVLEGSFKNIHMRTHRWCSWKKAIICFSLLRNLLSCFQPGRHPPSLHPSFLPSAAFPTVPTVNTQTLLN